MRLRRRAIAAPGVVRAVAEVTSDAPPLLDIVRLGHPVLRSMAEPVPEDWFGDARLADLVRAMVRTMIEKEGVGLAAPQVAEGLRLFTYWVPESEDRTEIPPTILVNPEIRVVGDEMEMGWEGCLSIPGLRGLVPRHRRIKVKARDIEGEPVSVTADGFHARVIQHEHDHLDGIVFLDRMTSVQSLAFEPEWERFVLSAEHPEP
jgi:peptide deformylase